LLLPVSGFAYTNEQKIAAALFKIPIDKIDSSMGVYYSYNPWKNNPSSISDSACGYIGGHTGIDMQTKDVAGAATANRKYYAVSSGQVITAGGDYGTVAIYDSTKNITVLYLHSRQISVTKNSIVKVGDVLGIQGDTGSPGAEHVHLETRQGKHSGAACKSSDTINPVTTITNYLNNNSSNDTSIGDMYNDFKGISVAHIQTFLDNFTGDLKNQNLGNIYDLDENNFYNQVTNWNLAVFYGGVSNMSPAEIIYYSAKENNINPILLIAKIQQEQSLISQSASQHKLNRATGYGIPNSNPSGDPQYKSFLAQLTGLTYQFDKFRGQGLSFREAYDTYTVDNTGQDASYNNFMEIYENYAVLMDDIILDSGGTPVEPPRMSAPDLRFPSDGSTDNPISDVNFGWYLKNSENIIDDVRFTLREATAYGGSTGDYVGSCSGSNGKSIGIRTNYSLNQCGDNLKPDQWYKWAVSLSFNNGSKDEGFVGFFKTEALDAAQRPTLLLPVNGSENIEELLQTRFTWTLNNPSSIIDDVQFTLREASGNNGSLGAYVGNCNKWSLGVREATYVTNCGPRLKAGQWYRWSVALYFNNGLDPINQEAFFKTQSDTSSPEIPPVNPTSDFAWHGNGSIISYHHRLLEPSERDGQDYPYGVTRDVVKLHANSTKPIGFFQWQVNMNDCQRLQLFSEDFNDSVDITIGKWNSRADDITFENVSLPFVIGDSNTGGRFNFVNGRWLMLKVALHDRLNQEAELQAICTSNNESNANYIMGGGDAVVMRNNYQWAGNGSVISHMYRALSDQRDESLGTDWPFGAFQDKLVVTPSSQKSMVFFQWQQDEVCRQVVIDASNNQSVTVSTKRWNETQAQVVYQNSQLPVTLSATGNNGNWQLIQVQFDSSVNQKTDVTATCH
jgi:murein DD-endopeptidase MepM/ murein hydrolase activator NlpD